MIAKPIRSAAVPMNSSSNKAAPVLAKAVDPAADDELAAVMGFADTPSFTFTPVPPVFPVTPVIGVVEARLTNGLLVCPRANAAIVRKPNVLSRTVTGALTLTRDDL